MVAISHLGAFCAVFFYVDDILYRCDWPKRSVHLEYRNCALFAILLYSHHDKSASFFILFFWFGVIVVWAICRVSFAKKLKTQAAMGLQFETIYEP